MYRQTAREPKREFERKEEETLMRKAEAPPYTWLRASKTTRGPSPVETTTLLEHFRDILASQNSIPLKIEVYSPVAEAEELRERLFRNNLSA